MYNSVDTFWLQITLRNFYSLVFFLPRGLFTCIEKKKCWCCCAVSLLSVKSQPFCLRAWGLCVMAGFFGQRLTSDMAYQGRFSGDFWKARANGKVGISVLWYKEMRLES